MTEAKGRGKDYAAEKDAEDPYDKYWANVVPVNSPRGRLAGFIRHVQPTTLPYIKLKEGETRADGLARHRQTLQLELADDARRSPVVTALRIAAFDSRTTKAKRYTLPNGKKGVLDYHTACCQAVSMTPKERACLLMHIEEQCLRQGKEALKGSYAGLYRNIFASGWNAGDCTGAARLNDNPTLRTIDSYVKRVVPGYTVQSYSKSAGKKVTKAVVRMSASHHEDFRVGMPSGPAMPDGDPVLFFHELDPPVATYVCPATAFMFMKCVTTGCPLPHLPGLGETHGAMEGGVTPGNTFMPAPPGPWCPMTFAAAGNLPSVSAMTTHVSALCREQCRMVFPRMGRDACSVCGNCPTKKSNMVIAPLMLPVEKSGYAYMKAHEAVFEMSPPTFFSEGGTFFVSGQRGRERGAGSAERARILVFCREALAGASYPLTRYYPDIAVESAEPRAASV